MNILIFIGERDVINFVNFVENNMYAFEMILGDVELSVGEPVAMYHSTTGSSQTSNFYPSLILSAAQSVSLSVQTLLFAIVMMLAVHFF